MSCVNGSKITIKTKELLVWRPTCGCSVGLEAVDDDELKASQ